MRTFRAVLIISHVCLSTSPIFVNIMHNQSPTIETSICAKEDKVANKLAGPVNEPPSQIYYCKLLPPTWHKVCFTFLKLRRRWSKLCLKKTGGCVHGLSSAYHANTSCSRMTGNATWEGKRSCKMLHQTSSRTETSKRCHRYASAWALFVRQSCQLERKDIRNFSWLGHWQQRRSKLVSWVEIRKYLKLNYFIETNEVASYLHLSLHDCCCNDDQLHW